MTDYTGIPLASRLDRQLDQDSDGVVSTGLH